MLTCVPRSIFSWSFEVHGAAAGPAEVTFHHFTEQGEIVLGSDRYEVRKHGVLSGHWTLEQGGLTHADAHKPSAFFRAFDIRTGGLQLTARAVSPFARTYELVTDHGLAGGIRTAHAFSRRAFVECGPEVPEPVQLFAFWLAALTWRRAARNNNN
jgi:hypothetical protein